MNHGITKEDLEQMREGAGKPRVQRTIVSRDAAREELRAHHQVTTTKQLAAARRKCTETIAASLGKDRRGIRLSLGSIVLYRDGIPLTGWANEQHDRVKNATEGQTFTVGIAPGVQVSIMGMRQAHGLDRNPEAN